MSGPPTLAPPRHLDRCLALYDYRDARPLVTALKNGNRRDLVTWIADRLAAAGPPPPGSTLTWAPTSPARRRARGYDHAELLARAVARRWHVPCAALLHRLPGPAQAGLRAEDRRDNPSFRAARRLPAGGVVLVDDVVTTGATLAAAAASLRGAGAAEVLGRVVARAAAPTGHRRRDSAEAPA